MLYTIFTKSCIIISLIDKLIKFQENKLFILGE